MGEGPEPLETIETGSNQVSSTARVDDITARSANGSNSLTDQTTEEISARYDRLRRLSTKQIMEKLMRKEKAESNQTASVDGDILAELLLKRLVQNKGSQEANA
jgi:hypothetical protein